MKIAREVALSRQAAPDFLPLTHHELVKLRQIPGWMRWLYVELLQLADMKTGAGRASWPRLLALMDFDQAPTGKRRAGAVTLWQARSALDELAAIGLIARDKRRNEAQGFLFFHVQPRRGFSAPDAEYRRGYRRGSTPGRASNGAASSKASKGVTAGVTAGGSGMNSNPLPLVNNELSTGREDPRAAIAKVAEKLRAGRR